MSAQKIILRSPRLQETNELVQAGIDSLSDLSDISTIGKQEWWKKEQERRKKSGCISSGMEI